MNAKELAEICDKIDDVAIECDMAGWKRTSSALDDISTQLSAMIPRYRPPQPSDDGKWCFLEELPSDAPPTLVRIEPYIHDYPPHVWQYWTVAGWRVLTKGVCPCERPE